MALLGRIVNAEDVQVRFIWEMTPATNETDIVTTARLAALLAVMEFIPFRG